MKLQWRHNGWNGVSNHQPYHCLLNRLFRRRSKKASKLRVTGLCARNSPMTGEFPAQMASNADNVSIWWRHHERQYSRRKIYHNESSVFFWYIIYHRHLPFVVHFFSVLYMGKKGSMNHRNKHMQAPLNRKIDSWREIVNHNGNHTNDNHYNENIDYDINIMIMMIMIMLKWW